MPLSDNRAFKLAARLSRLAAAGEARTRHFQEGLREYVAHRRALEGRGKRPRRNKHMVALAPFIAALPEEQRALGAHISLEAAHGRQQAAADHEATLREISSLQDQVRNLAVAGQSAAAQALADASSQQRYLWARERALEERRAEYARLCAQFGHCHADPPVKLGEYIQAIADLRRQLARRRKAEVATKRGARKRRRRDEPSGAPREKVRRTVSAAPRGAGAPAREQTHQAPAAAAERAGRSDAADAAPSARALSVAVSPRSGLLRRCRRVAVTGSTAARSAAGAGLDAPTAAGGGALAAGRPPELALLEVFAATTLVFAADFLARVGRVERHVFEEYLAKLRELRPGMADAYQHDAHCTVSFLTDTGSMKLIRSCLSQGELTAGALYNVVLGQTVLSSWRKLEALGPFAVEAPPTAEEFRARHEQHFPGVKAAVPAHLKQGVLSLLGEGPELDAAGRFVHDLAGKIPAALEGLRRGDAAAVRGLGLPAFRELLVVRLLAVVDPRLCDWGRRDLGDYAQLGLWLLDGMEEGAARAAVQTKAWRRTADVLFDDLLKALPAALRARDEHGIIEALERLGLCPLAAQNVEHMLCEFRKLLLPGGRPQRGEPFEGYRELWEAIAPVLLRRGQ